MRYVIMLTLDPATTDTMERVEREIALVHTLHRPFDSDVGPHITLAACEDLDLPAARGLLDGWAGQFEDRRVEFRSLGVFPLDPAVVFAAPVVTSGLLDHHVRFHRTLATITSSSAPHYEPGLWVPHCTLAERIPSQRLPEVVAVACALSLPLAGQFVAVQLAEFPTARILHTVNLG